MKKTYLKALALLCYFMFSCKTGHAQQDPETERLAKLSEKLAGTYQVQVIDSRDYFSIPLNYFDSISNIRHATETKYVWFKPNIRIMVPPYSAINAPGFSAMKRVTYISSNEK